MSSPKLPEPGSAAVAAKEPEQELKIAFSFPTDADIEVWNTNAFQPTASGRPESAFYGSVRTARAGRRLLPSFHEGIDIAAIERDKAGRPQDAAIAAANGQVVFLNRRAGNSNYGKYAVLAHGAGPGKIYTLYAHLDEITPGLNKGQSIQAGDVIGIMGSTSTDYIPPANAHLHFEINLMLNSRFNIWFRKQKLTPDHGLFNGWNLIGINPLEVYEKQEENNFDLYRHIRSLPPAFKIALKTNRQLDYFRRYAPLWHGAAFNGDVMVIACSENGLPLSGRNANENEIAFPSKKSRRVYDINPSILGRNGCRLVIRENGNWRLGSEGEKWLSMLMY